MVVRLVWDAGEHGRFVVGLRLVNAAAEDLIDAKTMGFTFEPADVEDLTGRTIIVGIPSLRVSGPGMMFGLVKRERSGGEAGADQRPADKPG